MNRQSPHVKERLLAGVSQLLAREGYDPRIRVHLVLDGEHIGAGDASFGTVGPDRLRLLIDRTFEMRNKQTFDAVNALSKFTLGGIPPHLRLKTV